MYTKYKFIHFEEVSWGKNGDHKTFWCINNRHKTRLGLIEYYRPWKQYVFEANGDTVFSQDCLEDIIDFMKQLK